MDSSNATSGSNDSEKKKSQAEVKTRLVKVELLIDSNNFVL